MSYVYLITNNINQKKYVGQTSRSVAERWKEHCRAANNNTNRALYRAFRKYGVENFSICLLEECPANIVGEREQYWIQYYNTYTSGYNMTCGGEGSLQYNFSYEELYHLYWELSCSAQEIALLKNCNIDTVYYYLHHFNLSKTNQQSKRNNKEVETIYQGVVYRFRSQMDAARWCVSMHFTSGSLDSISANIGRVCRGLRQTCCGLKWNFTSIV